MTFTIEIEREEDGRWLAEVLDLSGAMFGCQASPGCFVWCPRERRRDDGGRIATGTNMYAPFASARVIKSGIARMARPAGLLRDLTLIGRSGALPPDAFRSSR